MSLKYSRLFHKWGISRKKLKGSWLHQRFGDIVMDKNLWTLRRESLARAWLVGVPVTTIPMPGQTIVAGALCLYVRGNMPFAFALQFASTPLTAPIHLPPCYIVGNFLMGRKLWPDNVPADMSQLPFFLWNEGLQAILPLYLGAIVLGILMGVIGYGAIRLFWPADKHRRDHVHVSHRAGLPAVAAATVLTLSTPDGLAEPRQGAASEAETLMAGETLTESPEEKGVTEEKPAARSG
ncbi:hypothetical protein DB346_01675 [Verrucomicrobia bacterium LW23]|nr:hypothetical protein DB346_01675 [Verrucomicrobia bacterium LW23]